MSELNKQMHVGSGWKRAEHLHIITVCGWELTYRSFVCLIRGVVCGVIGISMKGFFFFPS